MALRCMTLSSLFLLLALTGCYKGAGIEYTSPADGEENVDPNTNVVVGFSQPMDADSVTMSTNYVVRGSISGEHEITASYNSETRELTITSAGSNGGGGEDVVPDASPDEGTGGGGSTESPDISDPFGPGGLLNPDGTPRNEDDPDTESGGGSEGGGTVTGTAGDAFTFTPGETVTVELSDGITNNISVPLDSESFSFKVAGTPPSGFEPESGEFLVASASPSPGGEAASLSPLVEITFDRPINRSSVLFQSVPGLPGFTFPQNVYVTGSLSGDQRGSVAFLGGDGDATASAMRLTGLSFLPGESVTVSLDQQITAPIEAGGNAILRPYSYSFRIPTGHAQLPFGDVAAVNLAPEVALGRVLDIAVGDFTSLSDNGSELVVLESDGDLHLLIQSANGAYLGNAVNVITGGAAPVGMRHADLDADGNVEFLVLFADGTVVPYSVADIALEAGAALTDPLNVTALDFEVADLDGDGLLDVVMATDGGYAVLAQASTTSIDGDGQSTTTRAFAALLRSVDGGFRNVALGDIESDGRVDMILSGNSGHRIFRNASDFAFQAVGTLAVQSLDVNPLIVDFEGDGDNDIVAAQGTELLVFVNEGDGVPAGGNWATGFTDTLLNSNDEPTTFREILVVNADGDPGRLPDVVVYGDWTETERYVAFCRRASTEIGDYDHSTDAASTAVKEGHVKTCPIIETCLASSN
ncbi:MAG: FG-GAP-like repeat-containing protein, partial [Planctomycetota bacterium]